jgi:hypothetical protein
VAGKYGQALSFNGTNNYVEVPSSGILAPSNITIEFWVKVAKSFLHSIRRVCLSQQQNQRLASYKRVEQWKNISARGTTQVITTLSWQGTGSINVTVISPSQNYTEDMMSEYQKTVYSTSGGTSSMLNIKRLSVTVNALSSDQDWYVMLTYSAVDAYQITVEVQKKISNSLSFFSFRAYQRLGFLFTPFSLRFRGFEHRGLIKCMKKC